MLSPPLVVDGIGCLPVTPNGAKLFFRLIDEWYGSIPTVLTSGEGFEHRGEILHGEVMPAAFLDRLLHHSHIVDIRRNSYRVRRPPELPKAIHTTASRTRDAESAGRERNRKARRGPAGSVHCSMANDIAHVVHSFRMPPPAARTRAPATVEPLHANTTGMDGIRAGDTPKRRVGGAREPAGRGHSGRPRRGLGMHRAQCRSHHPEPPATVRPPFIFADRYAVHDDYETSGPASARPPIHD